MSDTVLREYLEAAKGDMQGALYRMASTIQRARDRVEDGLPQRGLSRREIELLWRDIHPNTTGD